ncbi:MAG: lipocalin family protein [Spirochaetales bacterium]|nr:lipocalin family protein [Spirochaetales bacterium]
MKQGFFFLGILFVLSCTTTKEGPASFGTAEYVDRERFWGDWYVQALIPTVWEKNIANGVETYSQEEDGSILVTYRFRKGSPQGREKVMYQKGWIVDEESNGEWRVSPLWPLKFPYYVWEVGSDYDYAVIGTDSYNYLWIMSRSPVMDGALLEEIIGRMVSRGYRRDKIVMMEQVWEVSGDGSNDG